MRTGSSVTAAVHSGMAAAIPSSSVTAAIPSRGPDARGLRLTELPRVAGTSSLAPPPRRLLLGLSKRRRSKRERLDAILDQTGCLPCPSNAVIVFSFSSAVCFSSCRRMRNGRHRRSYVLCSRKSPKLEDLVPRNLRPSPPNSPRPHRRALVRLPPTTHHRTHAAVSRRAVVT